MGDATTYLQWLVWGLLGALAAALLERLARLLFANRGVQNDALGLLRDQLQKLRAENRQTGQEMRGQRTRAKTILNDYEDILRRINDIEKQKEGLVGALRNMWNSGRQVAVNAQ